MNVLLVEDNQTVRDSLAEFLRDAGHTILECSQGEEALDQLKNHAVDLVLSDIQMPVMDGHKLLSRIKSSESWKGIEVVLFTGYGHVKDAVEAMRKGAYDYLVKPVNVNELDLILKRISEYLALKQ
ncbi:MAG TPA: response regulator, partial [bacterium]